MEKNRNYQTYLLRLWRDGEDAPWRFALKESHTDEQISFGDLKMLTTFLEDQMKRDDNRFKSRS